MLGARVEASPDQQNHGENQRWAEGCDVNTLFQS